MNPDQPDMRVEKRQARLQSNAEARERWMRRLFRAATELKKLEAERKRLLYPNGKAGASKPPRRMSLEEIRERAAVGGDEFNDEIPS